MTQSLARISARRPLAMILVWVVLVLVAGAVVSGLLGTATTTELRLSGGFESEQAAATVERLRGGPEPVTEVVIVQSDTLTVDDPAFAAKVQSVFEELSALGEDTVSQVVTYYLAEIVAPESAAQLVSADRMTTLITVEMVGDFDEASRHVEEVMDVVEEADGADGFRVLIGGPASISFESNEFATHDLEQGERVGVPVALLILACAIRRGRCGVYSDWFGNCGDCDRTRTGGDRRSIFRSRVFRHFDDYDDRISGRHRLLVNHHLPVPRRTRPWIERARCGCQGWRDGRDVPCCSAELPW